MRRTVLNTARHSQHPNMCWHRQSILFIRRTENVNCSSQFIPDIVHVVTIESSQTKHSGTSCQQLSQIPQWTTFCKNVSLWMYSLESIWAVPSAEVTLEKKACQRTWGCQFRDRENLSSIESCSEIYLISSCPIANRNATTPKWMLLHSLLR